MTPQEVREALGSLRFGANLSTASAAMLADLLQVKEFPAGAIVFEEGTDHPWLYVVVAGEVALEMCVAARGCTRILTLGPGDLLAWSALLVEGKMTATAIALTPVRLLGASAPVIRALCDGNHGFGYELMCEVARALAKRLVATRLQLLDLYDISGGRQSTGVALG
jgi:CRP/FNR family cyclic AMP-dependent transcriptional regulator